MTSLALSLLAVLALATTSYGAVSKVNLDDGCDVSTTLNMNDVATVSTAGSVPLGGGDCVNTFVATDTNNECEEALVLCVNVTSMSTMCYVSAEFSSQTKVLKLDCFPSLPKNKWCVNGRRDMTLRLYQNHDKDHSDYSFNANVYASCAQYDLNPNKGGQSEPGHREEDIIFLDVEEAVHNTRVIGIVVGVCLACMFLIALLITYFYYKNKAYTGVPSEA
ncbi:uncharacterized protein LOC117345233 [Pecten maximus]|uniref:uncharacterized protein LOC117345233 n=1 Tax=Pecten maximus TaxID=6579 RepID=UPI001458043B|nr:uncharacterized protein LOC117345233 [Pecten maximus]XP_033764150.1 uncharacterized protein LOC117345233 [Pecten maximus]